MKKKLRYKLHWASGLAPKPQLKWVIYDWTLICPIAYAETRVGGRKLCDFLNEIAKGQIHANTKVRTNRKLPNTNCRY